ncbi:guanine deaminase isoform X1 [Acipenser oxyrinchus oxyrinchus]|uniref:Guanine deaminase n=1 Tax=Acipenser oxyrinchus oxyrinchus TaxID=40147 RepID=A0AAD8LUZ1_ACIOX|nr:guanine deaminase isoform X1 [Acipenser oxyrinchus oxyrinchus]
MTSCNESVIGITSVFKGAFVHSTHTSPMDILENFILGVSEAGKIVFIEGAYEQENLAKRWGFRNTDITHLKDWEFFIPGMVDTHIHASQYSYMGTGLDMPLLQWLNTYTFPAELKYKKTEFAEEVYNKVVKRTLKNGTTTACYFATIHTDSTLLLGEIADKIGQRALVGKVCMDINNTVEEYKETTEESVEETKRFISTLLQRKYPQVKPIITPRFVLSCSDKLLKDLGFIAKNNDLHIQSHISENTEEVQIVKEMFPDCTSYTDVYNKYNLLTNKTVMAHGCHLTDKELDIFNQRGAAISHCPNSNLSLCSGLLDVRNVLKHKVKIGLGTDVSGGYSPSMLDAIRRALDTSKALTIQTSGYETLTYKEVFRLATLGGSQALALEDTIGNFEVGKDFDAVLVSPSIPDGPFDVFAGDTFEVVVEKFLNLGDDRNMVEVYVAGKKVVPFKE